ncbi:MAG TPA: S8 family serine peptidase, partial [Candidatus Baltobacteraceae bacterium]
AQFVGGLWQTVAGPGTVSGTSVSFAAASGSFDLPAGVATYFAFYTGGVIATPTPAPSTISACTTTNRNPQSVAREAMAMGGRLGDDTPRRAQQSGYRGNDYAPGLLEVSYDRARLGSIADVRQGEIGAGADTLTSQLSFPHIGRVVRVLRVSGDLPTAQRKLQALPGVVNVSRVGLRHPTTTAAELPNDPYLVNEHSGGGATGTLIGPPFYQNAGTGGQWDMHLLCVSHAWGYSQSSGNSFSVLPGALAGSVKIAIVDTGVDITHPDLAGKVVHSAMFESRNGTLTPGTMTDQNGHGTDVAGIAAADTNNDFGFAGAGYNAQIIAERVFGPPDAQGCPDGDSSDACSAYTPDIAAAINDAVSNGANVINLSLGGSCPDTADEQGAIEDAIAAGVVVVAAAGNESSSILDAPACDPGVIAAGASALNDGNPNGSGYAGTNSEYVASYSDYDSTNPTAWGVVAPGGDPSQSPSDNDLLHWIMNIYTSTSADPAFGPAQVCTVDPFGESGNCRIEIAGTSMASPHVAGVAALMLGANQGLTPARVKTILCQSALNINDPHQGCGRVDAYRAVARAVGDGSVP